MISRHINLLSLTLIALTAAACVGAQTVTSSDTPSPSTPLPNELVTPTNTLRNPTLTTIPTTTPTSVTTKTATPDLIQPPLPDVLLNLSSDTFPLNVCSDFVSPGQVWLAQYPYSTSSVLLSDNKIGFYYPTWAPDRKWIAYLAINPQEPQETVQADASLRRFQHSDSVWIMRTDGSERRRVSEEFSRVEATIAGGGCTPVGGIFSGLNWSSNSQWLAFSVVPPDDEKDSLLYALNVETGEVQLVTHKAGSPRWSPTSSKLALITGEPNEVEIVSVGQSDVTPLTFPLLQQLPTSYLLFDIQWSPDGNSLLVIGADRRSSSNAPSILWSIDPATGEWKEIADLGTKKAIQLDISGNRALICSSKSGIGKLDLIDISTGNVIGSIEGPNKINCDTVSRLKDAVGKDVVSFTSALHGSEVWVASLFGVSPSPQKIIDREALNFPKELEVIYLSWQP